MPGTKDPLSELLRTVRLTGAVFLDSRFSEPWSVATRLTPEVLPFMTNAAQIIAYHYVIKGSLYLSVAGEQAIRVRAGEIVLLPRNDPHILSSGMGLKAVSARDLVQPSAEGGLDRIVHGGGGAATNIVCGFLGNDEASNPLIATLPRVLTLDVREVASRDWIEASMRYAANERAAGSAEMVTGLARLSEALLVEAVRRYAAGLGGTETGWLKGLHDPQVGRALSLMHQDIGASWSIDALANRVAMSRSAFVERFTSLVGLPPMRYLTEWRLRTASLLLRESQKSVGQVGYEVGYASEEAFSRAFKRRFDVSPGRWRDMG